MVTFIDGVIATVYPDRQVMIKDESKIIKISAKGELTITNLASTQQIKVELNGEIKEQEINNGKLTTLTINSKGEKTVKINENKNALEQLSKTIKNEINSKINVDKSYLKSNSIMNKIESNKQTSHKISSILNKNHHLSSSLNVAINKMSSLIEKSQISKRIQSSHKIHSEISSNKYLLNFHFK